MREDKDEWGSRQGIYCVLYDTRADAVLSVYKIDTLSHDEAIGHPEAPAEINFQN